MPETHPDRTAEPPAADPVAELLRRLARGDAELVRVDVALTSGAPLAEKSDLLVQVAALLSLGAATETLRVWVDRAGRAGATESEIADVLVTIAPVVGEARVVAAAARLAVALGHHIEDAER